jgi:hypothetical protein
MLKVNSNKKSRPPTRFSRRIRRHIRNGFSACTYQGPRGDCLMKKTEGRKYRDTVPFKHKQSTIQESTDIVAPLTDLA